MTAAVTTTRAPVLVGHFEPGSSEWHAARANGIGGSEVAPVLGLSPFESAFSLWHRKQGRVAAVVENDQMYWGKKHEPAICNEFAERHPELFVATVGTYRHADRPWQIANPDRLLFDVVPAEIVDESGQPEIPIAAQASALLEAKTARDDLGWGEPGTDQIPVYYRAQCLWYLDVFGVDECHVAVLIAGSEYREYLVAYDPAEAAFQRDRVAAFLQTIRTGRRPSIDAHGATYQVLRELHPDIDDVEVEVPPAIAKAYLSACAAYDKAKERKARAVNKLLGALGNARRGTFCGDRICIRVPGRGDNPPSLRPQRTRKEFP